MTHGPWGIKMTNAISHCRSRSPIVAFVASTCCLLFSPPPWSSSTRFCFFKLYTSPHHHHGATSIVCCWRKHPDVCSFYHIHKLPTSHCTGWFISTEKRHWSEPHLLDRGNVPLCRVSVQVSAFWDRVCETHPDFVFYLNFRSGMVATLEAVWDRGHVVFGAACYMHGLLTGPDWQTLEVVFHILTCTASPKEKTLQ